MKLPNAEKAKVDWTKITGYLLSPSHPIGRAKATFFRRFGFRVDKWQDLERALMAHALNDVVAVVETPFGKKYIIEALMETPDKRNPRVRTVWFIAKGLETAQLVTAYGIEVEG